MVIDVREDNDTFRFADGGPGENIVHHQEEYNIAVISGEDGETEVAVRDIDNLVEGLRQVQKRAQDSDRKNTVSVDHSEISSADFIKRDGYTEFTGGGLEPHLYTMGHIPVEAERFFKDKSKAPKPEWIDYKNGVTNPVHKLDMVENYFSNSYRHEGPLPANNVGWGCVKLYRPVCDEDGVPYVYNDGSLEPWAEYVATDEDGNAHQFEVKPYKVSDPDEWLAGKKIVLAPDRYQNSIDHWTKTLRRVYR